MKRTNQQINASDDRKLPPFATPELCYTTMLQRGSSASSSISTNMNESARHAKRHCTYPSGSPIVTGNSGISAAAGAKKSVDFPSKLMDILLTQTEPNSICFLPEGEAIAVNKISFTENVLRKYFNGMKWTSAVRNFNRWGFRRISHPSLKNGEIGFHHLLFQKDSPHLVHRMKKDCDAQEVMRQLELGSEAATARSVNGNHQASGAAASLSLVETSQAEVILSHSIPPPLPLLRGFSPSLELREGSHQADQERYLMLQLLDAQHRRRLQQQQQQQYEARNPFRQFQGGHFFDHRHPGDR